MKQPITPEMQEWLFQNKATITCNANHYEVRVRTFPTSVASELGDAIRTIEVIRAGRKSGGLGNVPLDELGGKQCAL